MKRKMLVLGGGVILAGIIAGIILVKSANVRQYPKDELGIGQIRAALVISTNKNEYRVGEPITVTAATAVLYDGTTVSIWEGTEIFSRYKMKVFDTQGRLVDLTRAGLGQSASVSSRISGLYIDSDKVDVESFRLDTLFDLSEPGSYTLLLRRTVGIGDTDTPEDLVSNPVVFTRLP